MKTSIQIFILLSIVSRVLLAQVSNSSQANTIGFSSQIEIDQSRPSTLNGHLGRIIQINLRYPSILKGDMKKMGFSDYIKVRGREMGNGKATETYKTIFNDYFQWPLSQGADKSLIDSIKVNDIKMKAQEGVEIKPGKHPLVILMHGSAVDFAFLAESLAAKGYLVVNVPIKGYRQKSLDVNSIGMETEIRDFEFALSVLSERSTVDLTNITVVGFSFGGQSALGLACRNPAIKMVISYDGGIGDRFGARLINESHFCATENISAAILHIYDNTYTGRYLEKIKSFVYADRTLVGLDKIAHWHFTSFGHLASVFPNLFDKNEWANHGYQTIFEITMDFLSSKSKNLDMPHVLPKHKSDLIAETEHFKALTKSGEQN